VEDIVASNIPPDAYPEQWNVAGLKEGVERWLNLDLPVDDWAKEEGIADEEIRERLHKAADEAYAARIEKNSPELMTYIEKQVLLQSLDHLWREHLVTLDHLRQVIGWRGLAQRDPLNEYKAEAFQLFDQLIAGLREQVTAQLMRVEVMFEAPPEPSLPPMEGHHLDPLTGQDDFNVSQDFITAGYLPQPPQGAEAPAGARDPGDPATWGRVGRNDPCPCGSGKKYKHCHGQLS